MIFGNILRLMIGNTESYILLCFLLCEQDGIVLKSSASDSVKRLSDERRCLHVRKISRGEESFKFQAIDEHGFFFFSFLL